MAKPLHQRVVTLGGGTGHYTLLRGLRPLCAQLTAIVSMMDSGGSSGRLRDEYGILPPGDFTRCLIALSDHPEALRELLAHRFRGGSLDGHTLRNLLFTALEQLTGSTAETVRRLHAVFRVQGCVLPVTLERCDLVMHLENGRTLRGEATIDTWEGLLDAPVLNVYLDPPVSGYAEALDALQTADVIVLGPGDLYTSIVPNLLVGGVSEAIRASNALVIYVVNLMTKPNETHGYTVRDFAAAIELYLGGPRLDVVLYHAAPPPRPVRDRYAASQSSPVLLGDVTAWRPETRFIGGDLAVYQPYVRHDSRRLAAAIRACIEAA
ncbi:MAG TPA: gluconeogenesis factor YvcK family protein [Chloroflexota bacterium]|nr:gluconeogenesis factor YvcK family protein [Chloroflexota bacterium]HZU07678.1 gluconeogenesis factor YvcK family protein [Chloroflexota bacterium]